MEIMQEIEFASKIKFTGIVSNANLGKETTVDTILSGVEFAKELANSLKYATDLTNEIIEIIESIKKL